MPIYEYVCRQCGHHFEAMQKFADPPPACTSCDGPVDKKVSRSGFQFKGSGWYVTDYARKPAPGKTDGTGDGKADAGKADAKADKGESKSNGAKSDKAGSGDTAAGTTASTDKPQAAKGPATPSS